jgi:lambda repressor-like predicted transcriptional regulator
VELLGRYSNWTNWTDRLEGLGKARQLGRPQASIRRATVRRLSEPQLTELVAGYEAGASVYDLAERFKIHRQTVSQHLHRLGVTMRNQGLDEQQVDHAAVLYQQGWSLARIAKRHHVEPGTVRLALLSQGVRMRDTHGRQR